MKKVYVALNPADAHLVKGALEAEGIHSVVRGEALWSARGELPVTPETAPSVWVARDDEYEQALEVLAELKQDAAVDGPKWTCPSCQETNEPQFTACWSCGVEKVS